MGPRCSYDARTSHLLAWRQPKEEGQDQMPSTLQSKILERRHPAPTKDRSATPPALSSYYIVLKQTFRFMVSIVPTPSTLFSL
jgi:hypothetical protein